jgi:cytochrome c biogenesis protein CcdA
MKQQRISIWFFIGILLGIYGVLILASGINDLIHPYAYTVKMANLHADIWWGALLIVLALIYIIKFKPRNSD